MHKLFYILIPSCLIVVACAFIFVPISNFPQPSGSYGVGLMKYHWIDNSRQEENAEDTEHPNRELMVYVYYPTNKSDNRVSYDPDAAESHVEFLSNTFSLPKFVFSGIKSIKTYSQPNAIVEQSSKPFPVIIFSHGGGVVVQQYTYMLEELASHGFIVVGINHPYNAATVRYPNGRIVKSMYREKTRDAKGKAQLVEANAQDVSFVLNKIEELVSAKDVFWSLADSNKIGIMGHSFGGRTATKVIRKDPRVTCGINMDGGAQSEDIAEPFSKPFLFMIAEKSFLYNKNFHAYATETKPFLDTIHRLADAENSNTKVFTVKNVGHAVFIDTSLLLNSTLIMRFASHRKPDLLDGPACKVSQVLINEVMPNVLSFFEEKLGHKIFTADQLQTLAKSDIEFITKTIMENHPGPYNELDPEFNKTLNFAHQEALDSINKVKTIEDHDEVMQKYAKHFNDSHLNISTEVKLKNAPQDFFQVKNFELKEFMPKTAWITIPTFNPNNQQQDDLNKIIEQLPNYRKHKLIIFDLRGNTGGDSYWGTKILEALLGDDYVNEKINNMDKNVYVDWRVSKDNLNYFSDLIKNLKKEFGNNSEGVIQRQKLYDAMAIYLKKDIPLLCDRDEVSTLSKNNQNLCRAKIIVLTDKYTGSASLRFIDELQSLNHSIKLFGQTTGADSLYMQARTIDLPSKLGYLSIPMKVYRNRPRGNNEPYHPDVEFIGDIKNTKAVEQWVKENWQKIVAKNNLD